MSAKEIIDLRSDTVTKPTEEMLEAIRHAELGDDVFEEDPTVNRLERIAAERMGKEAALFVTSGTQANLISLMTNANRGDLVILESESHIYWYEVGGISAIAGLLPWPLKSLTGSLDPKEVETAIRPQNIHFPKPSLLCIENTHNRHGGTIMTPNQIKAISSVAHKNNIKLYLDGARIFNAAVALNVNVKEFTKHVDNLMFCLSKGLCCPIGSLLVGNQEFIGRARKLRKILGGGMRQAGIIAAPGIVALESMIERLKEDHLNARYLAEGISKIDGIRVNLSRVQTNMVYFSIEELALTADQFISKLKENDILALALSENKIRMVTHKGIEKEHVEKSISTIETISH
ncbi:low-specificity L-threonine aldolase [Candidatus Bathyarchaeota archaeon]|nr:low-specificity L-threonine aldolase [Candidatus Bathyarchaeota archaeon]TRO46618.1 low-specificity L-threonine aldolase [Candidatus Bathyarchaeota archaeon]